MSMKEIIKNFIIDKIKLEDEFEQLKLENLKLKTKIEKLKKASKR